ncbi:MAG: hypothetical protein A2Y78_00010 [Acidobacteria bacterium RBG_13_68_16]|nr:MAG: hypothetical protein A2Y78_00010 [Acidobacteria bacterium RBG_13_68_16]
MALALARGAGRGARGAGRWRGALALARGAGRENDAVSERNHLLGAFLFRHPVAANRFQKIP